MDEEEEKSPLSLVDETIYLLIGIQRRERNESRWMKKI